MKLLPFSVFRFLTFFFLIIPLILHFHVYAYLLEIFISWKTKPFLKEILNSYYPV